MAPTGRDLEGARTQRPGPNAAKNKKIKKKKDSTLDILGIEASKARLNRRRGLVSLTRQAIVADQQQVLLVHFTDEEAEAQ